MIIGCSYLWRIFTSFVDIQALVFILRWKTIWWFSVLLTFVVRWIFTVFSIFIFLWSLRRRHIKCILVSYLTSFDLRLCLRLLIHLLFRVFMSGLLGEYISFDLARTNLFLFCRKCFRVILHLFLIWADNLFALINLVLF